MKFAAFDLETARIVPDSIPDNKAYPSLGITCAALAFSDKDDLIVWQGVPQLSPTECQGIVADLQRVVSEGYTLLTWNGCSFDFSVLAQESGLTEACGQLALNHVDLMLIVTFTKGHYLGFDKALAGAGVKGKVKVLTLSDGTKLADMSGSVAPELWAKGEYQAVLAYLRSDVSQLIGLARAIESRKSIQWKSNSGRIQSVPMNKFLLVKECFTIPEPDVSWMKNPPSRSKFTAWIPR